MCFNFHVFILLQPPFLKRVYILWYNLDFHAGTISLPAVLGKYGHVGICYTGGSIYPKEVSYCNSGGMLYYRRNYLSQTDEVRD